MPRPATSAGAAPHPWTSFPSKRKTPSTISLSADASRRGALLPTVREGRNHYGRSGWRDPCPSPGDKPQRYRFRVYALGSPLELPRKPSCPRS